MEYYLVITNSEGESRIVPIADVSQIPVAPGDDVVVMDGEGNAVDVSLRPDEENLVLTFPNGESATLLDFYETGPNEEPITISLNPTLPEDSSYEFNSQTGNLPQGMGFSLMRYSNTEYVQFVEQIDELAVSTMLAGLEGGESAAGGGGGGDEEKPPLVPQVENSRFVDRVLDPVPDAVPDSASGFEDGDPIVLNLLANDIDERGGGLVIHSVGGIDVEEGSRVTLPNGTVITVGEEGLVSVEPGPAFDSLQVGESSTETFVYTIRDAGGNLDTSRATVTVFGVDDATVTAPDSSVTDEDTPVTIDVLLNDQDPDNSLAVSAITQPTDSDDGTVVNNGGNVTFTPGSNFNSLAVGESATTTFTYTTNTGSTETVTVTINGVNDAPDAIDDSAVATENSPLTIDVLANDLDPDTNDSLTITGVTQPGTGSVTYNAGDLAFDPSTEFDYLGAGETATVSFTYNISDGNGGTDTATVTVTVNGEDDATVTNPDSAITNEDTAVTIDVLANDSDPDASDNPLSITSVTQPIDANDGTVVNNGNDVTFTPGTNFQSLAVGESATTTFTYTTDTGATENATVTIFGRNDAPDAVDDARSTDQNTSIVVDVLTNDSDPDASDDLIVTGVDQPASGSVTVNASNQIVFNPGDDFDFLDAGETATVTFDYAISDGNGGTDTATVTITVTGTEDATVINPDSGETDEDTPVTIDVLANDSDADTNDNPLSIASVDDSGLPGDASVANNGSDVTFNPGTAFNDLAVGESEIVTFTYTTNTGATETVTVTVNGTNDGPVAVNDTDAVNEDATIVVNAANGVIQGPGTDTDADASDTLTVTAVQNSSSIGALVGNPLEGVYGTLTLNSDGSYRYTADQDAADPLAVGETVTDTFTYTIGDGNGGTDTATLTITVTGTNDAPLPNPPGGTPGVDPGVYDDTDTIAEDDVAPASGNVLANDIDLDASDVLIVSGVNGAAGNVANAINGTFGDITINADGSYDYFLDNGNATVQGLAVGETLTETFTYTADDQNGGTATATLTITITGTNDVPIANPPGGTPGVDPGVYDDADTITEDAFPNTTDGNVLSNDRDPDTNDTLTVAEVNGSAANVGSQIVGTYGSVTINENGSYSFVLNNGNAAVNGLDDGETLTESFTYTADDGNGGTATATLTITINGVDDATVINPDRAETDENSSILIDVLGNDSDVDDVLTVASVDDSGLPGDASVTNNGTDVTFNPGTAFNDLAAGETEIVTFNYTTNTGATETVTVTVNGRNDGPDAIDDTRTTDQDTPLVIGALVNDSDPDASDSLVITSFDQPTQGSVSLNAAGQLVFDPGDDFDSLDETQSATVTFDYTISDGNGGTDTATVTVTINGTDDVTVINPDADVTDEDTAVTIDVLANDSDVDDTLSVASVTQPTDVNDGVVVNNGGDVTFTPGSNFNSLAVGESATTTFTYTTNTGATETVTVTVNGTNDGPTAVDDTDSTDQNSAVNIDLLANDSDPDASDELTVTQINGIAAGGTITLASGALLTVNGDGTVDYDPNGQFGGLDDGETAVDSFTYVISDGNGGTSTATATVTVNGTDEAIDADPDSASTTENASVTIDVLANDSDPDATDNPLTIQSFDPTTSGGGAVSQVGQQLVFDPGTDFDDLAVGETEIVTFDYVVENQDGATATETVTLTVNGRNDGPDAVDDGRTTDQNTTLVIDALSNDTDPDASDSLQITGVDQPSSGSVSINASDQLVFNPGSDFDDLDLGESATVTFDYTISDGNGGTDTATVTVTVTGTEDATITNPDAGSTDEDTAVTIDVLANDSDPDTSDNPLSISSVTQPTDANDGVVVNNGGDVTFTPGSNFQSLAVGESATTTFTYTTDTGETENVTVTVFGANDAPSAADDADSTDQDTAITIDVLPNDSDPDTNDTLLVTGVTQPTRGSVTYNVGNVSFDPNGEFDDLDVGESATVTFSYDITDGKGGTDTATVTVTITGTEDASLTNPDTVVTNENTAVTVSVLANDSDPDTNDNPLSVASVTQPTDGNDGIVVNNGGNVTFTPGSNFNSLAVGESATTTFTYTTDTGATENVTVTVTGVNDAPTAVDDANATDQDTSVLIDVVANDVDPDTSDSLQITSVNQPSKGVVSISAGNEILFDPNGEFDDLATGETATVSFDYSIGDGNGGTDTATVTVTVSGTDDATVTAPDTGVTNENTAVTIDVLANDSDSDASDNPLSIMSVTQPADGNDGLVVNNGGNVTFTPGSNFNSLAAGESATTTFTYTTDTGATETVTVTVTGVNDAPTAVDDADTTDQGTPIVINVVGNDIDPDTSDSLQITSVNQPVRGVVSISAGNEILFDPNDEFDDLATGETATVTFEYSISDGHGGTDTATVTVTVNGTDDATVTAPDSDATDENTAVTIDVLANDSDPDASDNPLSIVSVTQPTDANDGLVVNNGGDLTFTPGSNFNSLAVGESATTTFTYTTDTGATENVTVTINGRNDAPTANPDADTTDQNTPITIDVLLNDVDPDTNDTLLIVGGTQPALGRVTFSVSDVSFDPDGDFDYLDAGESATVTFTYNITDGKGGTDTETVTVTVMGTEDATVTAPDSDVTDEDSAVTIDVLANDSDADANDNPLTIAAITQPLDVNDGTVVNNGGDITFTPGSNFQGLPLGASATTTFTYTTNTGATETVTVTVNGVNEAPTAVNDQYSINENAVFTATLSNDILENDSDPNGDPLQVNTTPLVDVTNGTLVLNSDGTFTYTPDLDFQGSDSFTYSIDDGNGATATATVTLLIDNDGDLYTNDVDLDDDNDGILDVDEGIDATIGFSVIQVPDHLSSGNVGELTDGETTYTGDSNLRLHHPDTLYAGDHAGVIRLDQEAPAGTEFTIYWENDDADGGDAQNYADALNASGLDHTHFDRNGDGVLDGTDFDVDGNGNVDSGTGDYSPLGIAVSFYIGDPGFPVGTGPGILVHREITPVELIDSVVHSFTMTAPAEFDYVTIESIADDDGSDPRLIEFEFNSTTNDGSNTFVSSNTDEDGDGTPNRLEVDSDDGGIYDVDETGNGGLDADNDGRVDGPVDANGVPIAAGGGFDPSTFPYDPYEQYDDLPIANDDFVASPTSIQPVTINVVANDTDQNGTIDPSTVDLSPGTPGIQNTLVVAGEGTWSTDGAGNVTFTPDPALDRQPTAITYAVSDNDGNVASANALLSLKYSAADIWFGNDESGSVDSADFSQSRVLISGTADQMEFSSGDIVFNAALFTWSGSSQQQVEVSLTDDKTQFVNDSANYTRNYSNQTDIGEGIVFGTQEILASIAARQAAGDPRADVPQVMVILTDASSSQIQGDSSLLSDAQAAKDAGIIMVIVAIQEAQQDPVAVAILEQAASLDTNGDPLVVTATNYADIDAGEIADLLNAIREAAATGLLPPVVIDMDGDGVEFDDIENGIQFDVDGDGEAEQVAWADEDDAVLVYDQNNNNDVDGIDEISFARYSDDPNATDLEGLRHFDSNDDLILDANDAEFDSFKLWQDRDGDGVVDDGEMMTLREAGIESLELVSDEDAYYTAGGDVLVHGEAGVNYADGTKGTLADAEFGFEELADEDHPIEVLTDEGEVLNLSESDTEIEDATPDLVDHAPEPAGGEDPHPQEGGAVPPTSAEEDAAAADAAMS